MKNIDTLTISSYFGGKARFVREITDLIDYDTTSVYIEPFGGMASTLLNKPAHECEIYSDSSAGLTCLFQHLSDPLKAPQLIEYLFDNTFYSIECFEKALQYRNAIEDNYLLRFKNDWIKDILGKLCKIVGKKKLLGLDNDKREALIKDYIANGSLGITDDNIDIFNSLLEMNFDGNINSGAFDIEDYDELKLAASTFVIYVMSRDGMGTAFSNIRFKSSEHYYKQVSRLYSVADRLNGVQVFSSVGALGYMLDSSYLKDKRAFIYADPSYLGERAEQEAIDMLSKINNGQLTWENIALKIQNENLGMVYKQSFSYLDHLLFLRTVYNPDNMHCKMLISNYDSELYNSFLSPDNGWTKKTIETVTGVGGKKNNRRTEVLWYNY